MDEAFKDQTPPPAQDGSKSVAVQVFIVAIFALFMLPVVVALGLYAAENFDLADWLLLACVVTLAAAGVILVVRQVNSSDRLTNAEKGLSRLSDTFNADIDRAGVLQQRIAGNPIYQGILILIGGLLLLAALIKAMSWGWAPGRVVVAIDLMLATAYLLFATAKSGVRRYLWDTWDSVLGGVALLVAVVVFAAAAFAALTYTITSYTDVHLTESGEAVDGEVEPLTFFYLWHLANAIPGNPMETLLVSPPYDHHSRIIGALVFAFAIAVVIPVIAYCTDLVKWRRKKREELKRSAQSVESNPG